MELLINVALLSFLAITAVSLVFIRNLFAVVMMLGIFSLASAGFFLALGAPDVALTEAAIGAGIAPVLMLAVLGATSHREKRHRHSPLLPLLVVGVTGAALVYGTLDMPHFASPDAPAHHHVAPQYIADTAQDTGVPNIVTAVLASYRGFDTFGEVVVIFTAGIGVLALLGLAGATGNSHSREHMRDNLVMRVISKSMMPLMLIFGLYIQFHGDYGPGGGFQAGVVFAAAFILYAMVYGTQAACRVISPRLLLALMGVGVLIYGGVGVTAMLMGGEFLGYSVLAHDPVHGQHLGILLVELGVGITVAAVMMSIFFSISEAMSPQPEEQSGR